MILEEQREPRDKGEGDVEIATMVLKAHTVVLLKLAFKSYTFLLFKKVQKPLLFKPFDTSLLSCM